MKERLNINTVVNDTINEFGNVKVICKLSGILENLGMSLMELSELTGIRYATLNELANNKKVTLNLQHVLAVTIVLRIASFSDLFEVVFEDTKRGNDFVKESYAVHEGQQGLPDYVLERRAENKQKVLEWKSQYKKTLE